VDFGSVLVGATAEQPFEVANSAIAPADELDYTFGASPAGFGAPAGSFVAHVGIPGNHTLSMSTAAAGAKAGTLTLTTDAPDSASKQVQLSGTVLAHAVPSLDSLAAALEDTLDFGTHATGEFPDLDARVHNLGWNPLQARLAVGNAAIAGGDGRFSIPGGFSPATIGGLGRSWAVRFDGDGAAPDSTYEAALTFSTADEPLPGATALANLVVRLVARTATTNGVPGAPAMVRFHAPRPNPATRGAVFAFDLPRETEVALEIFDLAGRRVATLASGAYGAGTHTLRWGTTGADGARVGAGLYFARFRAGGVRALERLIILP
jgi:hypothetical protein